MADGVRAIVGRPRLAAATVLSMLSYGGYATFVVSVPIIGRTVAGRESLGPVLLSVAAVSSIITLGALSRWVRRVPPYRLLLIATAVVGVGLIVTGAAQLFVGPALGRGPSGGTAAGGAVEWLTVAGAFVVGCGEGPQMTALLGVRHEEAPEHLRTQVFATAASIKVSAFAIGAAIAGQLLALPMAPAMAIALCLGIAAACQAAAIVVAVWITTGTSRPHSGTTRHFPRKVASSEAKQHH